MMIKANGEYLDFDGEIEIEKQIKLFEDISTADGDFSYAFEIPKTINNTRILEAPFPDNILKLTYVRIPSEVISDDGLSIGIGYLRIERISDVYECSFFAGNNNWFALLTGSMMDLDYSEYEQEINIGTITSSWNDTDGVKYPLVDLGNLSTRNENVFQLIDFMPFMFVHSIMEKVFDSVGVQITGELLLDPQYQKMMYTVSRQSDVAIKARSSYIGKSAQHIADGTGDIILAFDDQTTTPYFDGDQDNFNIVSYSYTADLTMIITIELALNFSTNVAASFMVKKNGIVIDSSTIVRGPDIPFQYLKTNVQLNDGDVITFYLNVILNDIDITSGFVKITPTAIFKTFSDQIAPNWTKQKFIANVLKNFNVISSYDTASKTVTFNLFDRIKSKPAIDLSEFISEVEVDYAEFISGYAKNNLLEYQQMSGFPEIDDYNNNNQLPYGNGGIASSNEFIENEKAIITSDFTAPFDYYNAGFDLPLARLNVNTVQEGNTIDVQEVDDVGGIAEFVLGDDHGMNVGDLIRITNSTIPSYNGDHIVSALVALDRVQLYNVLFADNANLDFTPLNPQRTNSNDVFIVMDTGNLPGDESFYTGKTEIVIALPGTIYETDEPALVFFNMPNVGREINNSFQQSLSFGPVNLPDRYQTPIKDIFFRLFTNVLNDPVKIKPTGHIPYSLFLGIDFLSPIHIKSMETSNLYYLNRISGYKNSFRPCELALIKI